MLPRMCRPPNATATQRLLPGEGGGIDSSAALVALAEMGFDGPVTPTAHAEQAERPATRSGREAHGQALDKVWKGAGLTPAGKLAPPYDDRRSSVQNARAVI